MEASLVYILCAVTSFVCAVLLWRGYQQRRTTLLLWSGVCFIGLAFNNALLFIDLGVLSKEADLSAARNLVGLFSVSALLYGLIWEESA